MTERKLRDYQGWLARPRLYVDTGIHRLKVTVRDDFAELFQEFCRDREWDCELEEGPDFESSRVFLVEYQRSDDYDTLDEELNDLAWVFADYLKQKYGEDDPRSEKP